MLLPFPAPLLPANAALQQQVFQGNAAIKSGERRENIQRGSLWRSTGCQTLKTCSLSHDQIGMPQPASMIACHHEADYIQLTRSFDPRGTRRADAQLAHAECNFVSFPQRSLEPRHFSFRGIKAPRKTFSGSVVRPVSTSLTCLSPFSLLLSRSVLIAAPQQVFQGSAAMGPTARWSTNITRRRSAGQRGRNHPNGERNWGALNTRPNYDLLSHVTLHPTYFRLV